MSITTPPKRKLEEFSAREIPKEISPLYPAVIDTLEETLAKGGAVTTYQREFSLLYTLCCLDKGAELRLVLAARAYVDLKAKPDRTPGENQDLQKLVSALKSLPKPKMDEFVGLVKKFSQVKTAEPVAIVVNEASPLSPDKGGDSSNPKETAKAYIANMQACLKGIGEHPVPNFNEAVAQAMLAIGSYPKNPDLVLQAAICYHARAGRDRDRTADERLQDLEKALGLFEDFLIITHKPPFNKLPEYQKRREVVTEKWNEVRQLIHEQKHGEGHRRPPPPKPPADGKKPEK